MAKSLPGIDWVRLPIGIVRSNIHYERDLYPSSSSCRDGQHQPLASSFSVLYKSHATLLIRIAYCIVASQISLQDDVSQEFPPVSHRPTVLCGVASIHVHLYHHNVAKAETVPLLYSRGEYR
jgi:hypothetical protein